MEENFRLTKKHKRRLDRMLINLHTFLATPEGEALSDRLNELHTRIRERARHGGLTEKERNALLFIEHQLSLGHSPSVREVSAAIGCTSSRTGARTVEKLVTMGLLKREENGKAGLRTTLSNEDLKSDKTILIKNNRGNVAKS